MPYFNIVTESADSTVATEYTPVEKNAGAAGGGIYPYAPSAGI